MNSTARRRARTVGAFLSSVLAATVTVLAIGCSAAPTAEDLETGESALADISDCFETATIANEATLVSDGYQKTGTTAYDVIYYRWGTSSYWKTVSAHRYEKGTSVRYATCKEIVASPLPLGTTTLSGTYYDYTCLPREGVAALRPCEYGWVNVRPGTATVETKDFGIGRLGGQAELTMHVTAVNHDRKFDEDVVLVRNGSSWSNQKMKVSFDVVDEKITAASIVTRPKQYDRYDPEENRLYDRSKFELASQSAPTVKTVILVEAPTAPGIEALPAKVVFTPSEGSVVKLMNSTSFNLFYNPTAGTQGSLGPNESVTLTVGLPSLIRVRSSPSSQIYVDLQRSP